MDYTIIGKKLILCDGAIEVGHRDMCDVIANNEIEEIYLPETIRIIHNDAFFDLPGIKRINIPDGVQHIGSQAFWGLDDLEELTLPITVPIIEKHAFCNCEKLTLTILGRATDIPSDWDSSFAVNIKELRFQKVDC